MLCIIIEYILIESLFVIEIYEYYHVNEIRINVNVILFFNSQLRQDLVGVVVIELIMLQVNLAFFDIHITFFHKVLMNF
jgi:hypothetical protein